MSPIPNPQTCPTKRLGEVGSLPRSGTPWPIQRLCATAGGTAFRLFALMVFGALLGFPVMKQVEGVGLAAGEGRAGGLLLAAMVWTPVLLGLGLGAAVRLRSVRAAWAGLGTVLTRLSPRRFLTLLVLPPLVVQAALILLLRPVPWFDGAAVVREAMTLAETGRMDPLTYYPPFQTWWYAAWMVFLGARPLVAQLSNLVPAALMLVAGYRLCRALLGPGSGRAVALAWAWYPSNLFYTLVTPYYLHFYTAFILLGMEAMWRARRGEGGWAPAALGGLVSGLGALTKAVLLITPMQAAAFWLIATPRPHLRTWIGKAALWSAALGLVLLPWAIRNHRVFGETVLINTSGPLVFYSANNPESDGLYSAVPDTAEITTPQDMLEHGRWCTEQAMAFIRSQPGAFARLVGRKFLFTWGNEVTYRELVNVRGRRHPLVDAGVAGLAQTAWALVVGLTAAAAFRRLRRREPFAAAELLLATVVLSHALVYLAYEGGARHHLPLVLPLLLFAALRPVADPP